MRLMRSLAFASIALLVIGKALADDYRVGDRLPNERVIQPGTAYRALNWDELMPADWDPMKPLKGLKLDELEDSDPRAIQALEKVKEAWNDAPIVPTLNNQRVEIPGFVVPLDADSEHIKEFLLVPFFGACIHVPPPPSNQVIHVILPKILPKDQQKVLKAAAISYGALSISGQLQTVSSNTSMGFSGYRIKADRVDPYKSQGSSPAFH